MIIVDIKATDEQAAITKSQSIPGFNAVEHSPCEERKNVWRFKGTAESSIEEYQDGILSIEIDYEQQVTAQDYTFIYYEDDEVFGIVRRNYWNARRCLHDNDSEGIDSVMPDGFSNSSESLFEYYANGGDPEKGKAALIAAGMTESSANEQPD